MTSLPSISSSWLPLSARLSLSTYPPDSEGPRRPGDFDGLWNCRSTDRPPPCPRTCAHASVLASITPQRRGLPAGLQSPKAPSMFIGAGAKCRHGSPRIGTAFLFSVAPVRLAHLLVSRCTGPPTHTECHSTSRPASFPNGHSCPASPAEAPVPFLLSGRLPPLHLVSQRRGSATAARRENTWHYWSSGSYAVPANPPTELCKRDALSLLEPGSHTR